MTSGIGSPEEGSVGTREAIASNSVVVRGDQEGLSEERTGRNTQVELDPETARVVERLKNIENEAEAAGRLIGSNWANETATLKELKEVATKPAGLFLGCRPVEGNSIWGELWHGPHRFDGDDGNVWDWHAVAFTRGVIAGASEVFAHVGHLI